MPARTTAGQGAGSCAGSSLRLGSGNGTEIRRGIPPARETRPRAGGGDQIGALEGIISPDRHGLRTARRTGGETGAGGRAGVTLGPGALEKKAPRGRG